MNHQWWFLIIFTVYMLGATLTVFLLGRFSDEAILDQEYAIFTALVWPLYLSMIVVAAPIVFFNNILRRVLEFGLKH